MAVKQIRCLVALMLMASSCAAKTEGSELSDPTELRLPQSDIVASYDSTNGTDDNNADHNDVIILILGQIQSDISKLDVKTSNLQAAVGSLTVRVRDIEVDVADLSTKQQIDYNELDRNVATLEHSLEDLSTKQQNDHNLIDGNVAALENTVEDHYQDLRDLSTKQQTDHNTIVGSVAELESTVEENYQELKDDIDAISATQGAIDQPSALQCVDSSKDYYYEWVDTKYTWLEARQHCINHGGDLAHHSFEPMSFREEVICGYFDLCMNGKGQGGANGDSSEWPWWGLHFNKTNECNGSYQYHWEYLDGTCANNNYINWFASGEYNQEGEECAGLMGLEFNDPYFLQAYSFPCNSENSRRPSICEYKCVY